MLRTVRMLLHLPLVAAVKTSRIWPAIDRDIRRQLQPRLDLPLADGLSTTALAGALAHRPLRTIITVRMRNAGGRDRLVAAIVKRIYKGETALELSCREIGPGFMMMHGFATIVLAERIGTDCQVAQQVTIGYSDRGGPPTIGDRVRVGAGAIVLGPIVLGDDCVVGAGAVVVKDVPPGVVVGGVPARVLESAADQFRAPRG